MPHPIHIPFAAQYADAGQTLRRLTELGCEPRRVIFDAGKIIYEAEAPADDVFLIQSGEVRIYQIIIPQPARLLDIFGPNDWFGSASLARLPVHGKRAVAFSDCIIWTLPADEIRYQISRHGDLALHILQMVVVRLHDAWTQGSALVAEDCRNRIIRTLIRFSTSPAAEPAEDGITLHMTHAQLAQAIGAARETVSVCLTDLRRQNIVRTGRNRLTFNPARLKDLETKVAPHAASATSASSTHP